jgi:lauroyl/myristoyl acyltransferase
MPGEAVKKLAVSGLRRAPLAVSQPLVRRRIRRAQADDVAVGVARRQMEFLLGASRPDADLEAVALRHLEQVIWRRELRWRPPVITRQSVSGIEHLTRLRGEHGGLVVCFLHHGRYEGVFAALKRAGGPPVTTVGHPMMFDPAIPDYLAANLRLGRMGSTPVPVTLGYAGLRDLVLDGHTLGIAVDLPGSTRVRFVGRDLRCASGAARIAHETGTPVVLVLPRTTDGVAQELTVSAPLLPEDHADAEALLQAILDGFEPSVLGWPEAYDWPKKKFTLLDADGNPVPHVREPGEPDI